MTECSWISEVNCQPARDCEEECELQKRMLCAEDDRQIRGRGGE